MLSRMSALLALLFIAAPAAWADDEIIPVDAGLRVIDWRDAGKYLDQEVIVQGKIVAASNIGKICFLNFDQARSFTAVIFKPSFGNFPKPPEYIYAGKLVRMHGVITQHKGNPQIEITKPEQITILEALEPIPDAPAAVKRVTTSVVTLATYNVLNLFDDDDDPYHRDEGTRPKPKTELEKLAETIRKVDADILAMQEVENRGYLEHFVRAMLPDMGYKYIVSFDGNDRRGIECAVLSRLPVGPVTSYRHIRFSDGSGGTMGFRRDLLRVRIEPTGLPCFDIFVVHLKSKRGGETSDHIRSAESRQARKILDGLLIEDEKARFVLCGDFNDTWDSGPMKIIRGEGKAALKSFLNDPPKDVVTFNKPPYRSVIDFILCSPAMAQCYVPKSCRVIDGTVKSSGSDHNPVVIQFDLNRG